MVVTATTTTLSTMTATIKHAFSLFWPPKRTESKPAVVTGPSDRPIWEITFGELIQHCSLHFGPQRALVVPWQKHVSTFQELDNASKGVAKALLASGTQLGDHVGILAGNRHEYIELFLGAARIGCPVVCINSTYTVQELIDAVNHSACTRLFIASHIGSRDMASHIEAVSRASESSPFALTEVISMGKVDNVASYRSFLERADTSGISDEDLRSVEDQVKSSDGIVLQFTSGTTGHPKAAMLTSRGIINNGRYVGDAMRLGPSDKVICPPPLFHTFGIVVGFLAAFTHSSAMVLPCDTFNAEQVIDAIVEYGGTALLGVPTMFLAELELIKRKGLKIDTLRTGIIGGTPVPEPLMKRIALELGANEMLIAYGTTETSPISFLCALEDPENRRFGSVGRVLPGTVAKVINERGQTLNRGQRGELCVSGYGLQLGYYRNLAKTQEVMRRDEDGRLWMHTGDECVIDMEGYCYITGRLKDIIVRGGENIYPAEVEARLASHSLIAEASVVGIKDERYGEVVAAFLRSQADECQRPDDAAIQAWVGATLGRHKIPRHIFWVGTSKVGMEFPKTGSGKIQKHVLRERGLDLLSVKIGA